MFACWRKEGEAATSSTLLIPILYTWSGNDADIDAECEKPLINHCVFVFMSICYGNPVKYHSLTDIIAIPKELGLYEFFRYSFTRDVWTVHFSSVSLKFKFISDLFINDVSNSDYIASVLNLKKTTIIACLHIHKRLGKLVLMQFNVSRLFKNTLMKFSFWLCWGILFFSLYIKFIIN